jgi:hypothetical protein
MAFSSSLSSPTPGPTLAQRSQVYTWATPHTASVLEEIGAIERKLLFAANGDCMEWEVLVSLKQPLAQAANRLPQTTMHQQQAQQIPPTYTLQYKDMGCVCTVIKPSSSSVPTVNDVTVTATVPVAAADEGTKLSSSMRLTQWRCHGRKYLISMNGNTGGSPVDVVVYVGSVDRGTNSQAIMEVVYCPDADNEPAMPVPTPSHSSEQEVDDLLDKVAYELMPLSAHLTIAKSSTAPITPMPASSTPINADTTTQPVKGDLDDLVLSMKERSLKWIQAITSQPNIVTGQQ